MTFSVSMFRQIVVMEVIDDAERYSLLSPEDLASLFWLRQYEPLCCMYAHAAPAHADARS